jgi:transposase
MLYRNKPKRVFFYGKSVDFRKQTSGLAMIVEAEFISEIFQGTWFVFVAQDKKKAKILYWRGTGFALWQFRLEKDLFNLGQRRFTDNCQLTWRDLGRLLDGYYVFKGKAHETVSPKRFS